MKWPTILEKILKNTQIKTLQGKNVHAYFDLDSTLFNVSPRIAQIFREYLKHFEKRGDHPKEFEILSQMNPHPMDYGVRRTLERQGIPWENREFIEPLVKFWKEKFFANDFLKYDIPYEGAQEYVHALQKAGAEIFYITGRDVPRMKEGTIESLKKHGFPLHSNHENLFLKPNNTLSDVEFKKNFFLGKNQEHLLFFENEPANIHVVLENSPHIEIVFVDTVHSQSAPPPPDHIPKILNWVSTS